MFLALVIRRIRWLIQGNGRVITHPGYSCLPIAVIDSHPRFL